jgi:hypothetical protein
MERRFGIVSQSKESDIFILGRPLATGLQRPGAAAESCQLHSNEFLCGREGGLESVCRVTLVGEDFTLLPFVNGADAHPIAQGQDANGFLAGGNFRTNGRRGARPFVQPDVHVAFFLDALSSATNSAIASRAMKSGWRLGSM